MTPRLHLVTTTEAISLAFSDFSPLLLVVPEGAAPAAHEGLAAMAVRRPHLRLVPDLPEPQTWKR